MNTNKIRYYIVFPRKVICEKPIIITHKPTRTEEITFGGFAEGGFETKEEAIKLLHNMGYADDEYRC